MGIFSSIAQITKLIARGVKLSSSGATGAHKKLMSSVTDPQLRSIFDDTVLSYRYLSLEENKMAMSWMEDIVQKLEMCSDETIRKTAEKINAGTTNKTNFLISLLQMVVLDQAVQPAIELLVVFRFAFRERHTLYSGRDQIFDKLLLPALLFRKHTVFIEKCRFDDHTALNERP